MVARTFDQPIHHGFLDPLAALFVRGELFAPPDEVFNAIAHVRGQARQFGDPAEMCQVHVIRLALHQPPD